MIEHKTCNACKLKKDISLFYKRPDSVDGFRNTCKLCFNSGIKIKHKLLNGNRVCSKCLMEKDIKLDVI